MGKVSPPSIKYIINAHFVAEGVVEKPDVIGAIFGQTEGLLGEELELRELQKKGKIGRINATMEVSGSKTTGNVEIPTSIDKAETTIIAAAIETIDRIGPCDAKFEIKSIEDVRSSKREYIIERAKKLMQEISGEGPELKEIQQDIINHTKISKVKEIGREMLAAGPEVEKASEIIVVEGRADVLNLLRCGIKNAVAMNGTSMPQTIKDLSLTKEVTLFVDGDRGGILIATDAVNTANVKYIARAPDGKEVEELTEKEVISCLRNRLSAEDFIERYKIRRDRRVGERKESITRVREMARRESGEIEERGEYVEETRELSNEEKEKLQRYLEETEGTRYVLLLNSNLEIVKKVPSGEIVRALYGTKRKRTPIFALVMDITVTPPIIRAAEQAQCKYIVARNFAATSDRITLLSF
ncbi:MAG: DNA primase [Candidatus Pacearchaeota archaeon]|nr:DNA primase [Candidatus Pacearchaeota archaeon]